ncbi:MAG: lipopolysaccharide biosynthesis protein [Hyphomicrobiales bacterium]|nr:lipopolysaccharide biosynthesis protein [Hyphomicrobiales bacterium]MDE2017784.1 lipopolysaccharide biosynthesis protein [Hyphomicrobiales bacterium]
MTPEIDLKPNGGALDRARIVSTALADAARRARFSARSRRAMSGGGFGAREGAKLMRAFAWATFALFVAIPTAAAAIYYGFVASDQYVSTAKFTVIGGVVPAPDGIAKLTGIPAAAIVQDTQVIVDYLGSRAAAEDLQKKADIAGAYSGPSVDFLSRLDPNGPVEELVRYWRKMIGVSIAMPAGVVTLNVGAYSPRDAKRIAGAAIASSEKLINDLNARLDAGEVATAEREFKAAADRLAAARAALENARNSSGILSATAAADALSKLVTEVRAQVLAMQRQYQANLATVSPSAPQMKDLKLRIDAGEAQIADLQGKITAANGSAAGGVLSKSLSTFSELDLENTIAERLYAGAAATLELAKLTAEHKLMYLNVFVDPTDPQEPTYPRRGLDVGIALAAGLAAWGAVYGTVATARNHMAR